METTYKLVLKYIPVFYLLIIFPVLFHLDHSLPGITAGFVGITLIITSLVILIKSKTFKFCWLDLLFFLFVSWCMIRYEWGNPSIYVWRLALGGASILLYIYVQITAIKNSFFNILFVAGLLQSAWYFLQKFGVLPSYHYLYPGTGSFFNPALLAILLVTSTIAGLYGVRYREKLFIHSFRWFGIAILLGCLITLGSRASWVALIAGSAWIILSTKRTRRLLFSKNPNSQCNWRKCTLLVIFIVILFSGGMYMLYRLHPESVNGRFLVWQVCIETFRQAPWFGNGSFAATYMPQQAAWFDIYPDSPFTSVAGNTIYAFNEFLRIAYETGIVGLALFVVVLFTALYHSFKGKPTSRFAGGILISIVVFGSFGYPFSVELITAITISALAMIAGTVTRKYTVTLGSGVSFILKIVMTLFTFVLAFEYYHEKKADVLLTEAQESSSVATSSKLKDCYERLRANPDFVLCYGKTLIIHEQHTRALPVLEQGFLLRPTSELTCDLGKCYQRHWRWQEAELKYRLAASMVPAYITPRYHLFDLYRVKNEKQKAAGEASRILTMPVKVVNTSVLRARGQAKEFLKSYQDKQ